MSSDLEDANEKVNGLRLSLEGAYKEMAEMRRGIIIRFLFEIFYMKSRIQNFEFILTFFYRSK